MTDIPHGKYLGTEADGLAKTEADHPQALGWSRGQPKTGQAI
jgi:hypothetical protein